MRKFGLLGRNIDYSFSRGYFNKKFKDLGISDIYENFDIADISEFPEVLQKNPKLKGLNVTIPYKEEIIPFLDEIDAVAQKIGAVNTIKIEESGKLIGFNTDYFGFKIALENFLPLKQKTALILGTGGASKAIAYTLEELYFHYRFVSRIPSETSVSYSDLDKEIIQNHLLIINCTPLGTFPNIAAFPDIPYHYLTSEHLLFDLIYNPDETTFLKKGKAAGAKISNGLKMLEMQAEKSWTLWNK